MKTFVKELLWGGFLTAVLPGFLFGPVRAASAADIPYTFTSLDISVPGREDRKFFPVDIDNQGRILTNVRFNDLTQAMIVKKKKPLLFACNNADTAGLSISKAGIVGVCSDNGKQVGFIRDRGKNGQLSLIDFPGADGTLGFGISADGKITGQFFGPLDPNDPRGSLAYRFHCFTWIDGQYSQIDFPVPNTYVSCQAINKRGQVLGEYITVTDFNDTVEHGWFIYDNGNFFTADFPLSFEHIGGPGIVLSDMNEDGQIIVFRWNTANNKLQLYDDGNFFDIATPEGWIISDVGGLNNKAEFVGTYIIQVGTDPFFGTPIFETHGFVATPAQ